MPSQQLLLSWKDHNGAVVSVFENLLRKNTLVDCTLAAEGQYLKAHKVVLSACSSYFELLFSQESEKNPIVVLKDVKFQELKAAVNFMYKGEVEVSEDRLTAFLEVADSLQIKGLGSDEKSRSLKEKSLSSVKSSNAKSAVTPRQQSRKDALSSRSDNAGQSPNVPADCELIKSNESSSARQSSRSESSRSTPTFPPSTSFSQRVQDTGSDKDNLENSQRSALQQFSSGECEQSDINAVIKSEPVSDAYDDEKSEEADRDFGDDVTMMEDEEDWDEHNVETMSDEQSTSQQDLGFTTVYLKTHDGASENAEDVQEQSGNYSSSEGASWSQQHDGQNFSPIMVKDEPSTSSSWSRQEPYCGTERGPNAGSSSASTGAEFVIVPDLPCNQHSTRSSTQFYHSDITGGPSTFCGISAEPLNTALQHQDPQLTETEKHVCLKCQIFFTSSSELETHMRFHGSSRVHKCPYCDYTTAKTSAMSYHLRTHSGERPYKCPFCTHRSVTNSDLTKHIRIHTGEKPYQCSECDYKSKDVSAMSRHRRKHAGAKPYQCPYCEFTATRSGAISLHKRKVHSRPASSQSRKSKNT